MEWGIRSTFSKKQNVKMSWLAIQKNLYLPWTLNTQKGWNSEEIFTTSLHIGVTHSFQMCKCEKEPRTKDAFSPSTRTAVTRGNKTTVLQMFKLFIFQIIKHKNPLLNRSLNTRNNGMFNQSTTRRLFGDHTRFKYKHKGLFTRFICLLKFNAYERAFVRMRLCCTYMWTHMHGQF